MPWRISPNRRRHQHALTHATSYSTGEPLGPCVRKCAGVTLRSLTTALGVWRHWRNVMLLNRKQREVHKQCRRLKQERLARLLADTAGSNAGLTGVFQLLRGLAPKAPRRKLQLPRAGLSSLATLAAIQTYYTHLFNQCPAPALGSPPATPLHITLSELKLALATLPAHKALPSRDAPAILWRAAAAELAAKCLPALNTCCVMMRGPPPENLNVAEICLIPKPSKAPRRARGPETHLSATAVSKGPSLYFKHQNSDTITAHTWPAASVRLHSQPLRG